MTGSHGPGNVVLIALDSEHVTEVFAGFGEKGLRAEIVAERAAAEAKECLDAGVPVGPRLANHESSCRWRSARAGGSHRRPDAARADPGKT